MCACVCVCVCERSREKERVCVLLQSLWGSSCESSSFDLWRRCRNQKFSSLGPCEILFFSFSPSIGGHSQPNRNWEIINFFWSRLYSFLAAAVTNDHKLSSLKQHTCIHSQFWRSQIWNGFYWPTNEETGRAGFLAHPSSFPASRSCSWPCITGTSAPVLPSHLLWLTPTPNTSLYEDLCNNAGLTGKIQPNL